MQFFKLYVILQLYALFSNVICDEADETLDDVIFTHTLKNIKSFFYKSQENEDLESSMVQIESNDQFHAVMQQLSSCKEPDEQSTREEIFYRRLINILLTNLVMQRGDDEKLIGALHIEASSSQFKYLQNFMNGQGSMTEVNKILENTIKKPEYSVCHYMIEMSHYFNLLLERLKYFISIMKYHWDITITVFTLICIFIILRRQGCSRGIIIFLLLDVVLVTSFLITWWRMIEEAEIRLMAAQAQFAEMPIACQPHKMGRLDKMIASFWPTNDCEKYYETIMTNPKLQVTPLLALTHMLSTIIFQPLSYLGLFISEFVENATSKLSFLYKLPIVFSLFVSFCVCIILLPISIIGGSLNFGIGPFFKFGIRGRQRSIEKQERIERIHEGISSKKQLKCCGEIKEIMEQDPASSDVVNINTHHLHEECEKCTAKHGRKEEGDGDR